MYILDPSLSTLPMTEDEWYREISFNDTQIITGYVTCEHDAYSHSLSYCFNPDNETLSVGEGRGESIKELFYEEMQDWLDR